MQRLDHEPREQAAAPAEDRTHKQSIVVRKDLNMRKGKMIAQGAHASMAAVLSRSVQTESGWLVPASDPDVGPWLRGRFAKIALGARSEEELFKLRDKALSLGLPCALIEDAGLTEFKGIPTITALAVGPGPCSEVDKVTGQLDLL